MLTISDAQINALVSMFIWPFTRIVGLFLADPFYSNRAIPRRFRAGFALMLTVLLVPVLPPAPAVPVVSAAYFAIVVQQLLIGLAMGFVMRLALAAVEMARHDHFRADGAGFCHDVRPAACGAGANHVEPADGVCHAAFHGV
ncbi:flagellar biosynthetic protein FliR [Paludibacterium denitrificans]|uniref:flagellar biosynthetic protein FliR n=1 Tax=Paludibacterium denitrificans TaxID=2675226 RepID=UPI001E60902B|nr:flagellar biosynthetic protein FliR [Paludibacterium denitrificans]